MATTISLQKVFAASITYVADHEANYTAIESAINALYAQVQGVASSAGIDARLSELFDRNGIFGKASYKPVAGVLTGPNYYLTVAAGAYWSGAEFRNKTTTTTIALLPFSTGTLYVNVPTGGVPTVTTAAGADTVWQFAWDTGTSTVSAVAFYSSTCDIFIDGDDWKNSIGVYEALADRLAAIEATAGVTGNYYAERAAAHSGLNFGYYGGKVHNDNVVASTANGTVLLTDATTNYIEVNVATGAVTANTSGFTAGRIPLFTVVTAAGAISTVTDQRTWARAGGGGGGGHTQNTDTGTDNNEFKLNNDVVGAPAQDCALVVERGTSPDVKLRWNETTDKWQYTNDGTNYYDVGSIQGADLGAQELTKFKAVEDPTLILEQLTQSTGGGYTQVNLGPSGTNVIADAPQGVQALVLRVAFWDSAPGSGVNVKFRKYGSIAAPLKAFTVWGGSAEHSNVMTLVIPGDDGNTTPTIGFEWLITASGAGTANVRVWLLGYMIKVTGTGTQKKVFTSAGNVVNAASNQQYNKTGFLNRGLVYKLKITETGGVMTGTYDVVVYSKDTFLAADILYQATLIDATLNSRIYTDRLPWFYTDDDSTSELHIKIINNDAVQNGTFTIELTTEQFL